VLVKNVNTDPVLIQPGLVVTYTLAYSNVGTGIAVGVVMTETVSRHTTFVAQASSPGWSCANGAPAGTKCTIQLGDVAPGQRGEVRFAVKLDLNISPGATIPNVALIGTETGQLETETGNNENNATIMIRSPTALEETEEPESANPLRLYMPLVVKE
jgi:uncharacterized repeat protein (TIGR01451 family)